MAWLTNFLQPTQPFLVAFDIASSSQNYLNPNGLQRDRQGLFQAIDQTRLVRRCVAYDAVGGQFLGDEYRLAFPVNGNHGAINATEVVEFVDEVFSTLETAESASIGYAPVVRAIMAKGSVEARELGGFGYLMGGVPFETLSKLSKVVGNQVNILVSDEDLRPMLESEKIAGLGLFVKRYSSRRIPDPFPGPPHNNACTDYLLISVTNARHQSDQGLIELARYVLSNLSSTISNLKVMVGPTSIVFAIPEAQFNQSRTLLSEIQQCAINYGQSIATAIGSGLGRVIPGSRWTTGSFESGTAIELCRITSELAPGTLAIPDRQSVIELLAPLSRSLTEQVRIRGKRDEVFDALVSDRYFGKYEGTTTSSANNSTVPTTSLVARPIDAWSTPVLYRQPGVFLQIQHKKRIALNQRNRILVAKLIRELLEECPKVLDVFFLAVKPIELQGDHNTKIDAVVNALVPINQSRRYEHETPLNVFRKIATYWVDHSVKIQLADHQDRVRVIRDLLYTISFPEDEAERMIEVISNALESTRPESAGPARAPRSIPPYQLGVKLLQTARALILEQQNNGGVRSSPLYKLLNEQLEKTDTSVFFESKYYKTTLLKVDAKKYAKKDRPVDTLAEISLQALVGKLDIKNRNFTYRFNEELEKAFEVNQVYFLIVPDSFPGLAKDISVVFTRLVIIEEQTGFDSNYHSSLITDYEKIKECLEKVFLNSFPQLF